MTGLQRITEPTLDVVEFLLWALANGREEVHGWAIMKAVKRSGPTVYGVLDRLEDAEWIASRWDAQTEPGKPRRRLYRVTPNGTVLARRLLAERRPGNAALSPKPGFALFGWLRGGCIDGVRGGA
jgi:PadR family transcriptional regulator, regulatory protein PadR